MWPATAPTLRPKCAAISRAVGGGSFDWMKARICCWRAVRLTTVHVYGCGVNVNSFSVLRSSEKNGIPVAQFISEKGTFLGAQHINGGALGPNWLGKATSNMEILPNDPRKLLAIVCFCAFALTTTTATSTERFVPQGGSLTYPSIQAAISAAAAGDTIRVQPGTYRESIRFGRFDITVTSLNPLDA